MRTKLCAEASISPPRHKNIESQQENAGIQLVNIFRRRLSGTILRRRRAVSEVVSNEHVDDIKGRAVTGVA